MSQTIHKIPISDATFGCGTMKIVTITKGKVVTLFVENRKTRGGNISHEDQYTDNLMSFKNRRKSTQQPMQHGHQ
jgi:hypothetical protein